MKKSNENNPFKTPEGYFDDFTGKLLGKLNQKENKLPEKDGFIVPDAYFDGWHEKLQKKIATTETPVVQLHPYKKYYSIVASVAAVALLIFGLLWNTNETPNFNDLAATDIEQYFEGNELGLSTFEIAEVIAVDELEINDILETQLNEEEVFDYLNDNITDFEELNLENYE